MTDELMQADENTAPEQTIQTDETPVIPQDGAEQSPAEETKVTFDDRQQAKFNDAIAAKTKATHDERRRADAAEAKLAELQASIPQPTEPQIPQMPGEFDDDFDKKMSDYTTAIEQRAEFKATAKVQADQTAAQQQTQLYEQQQKQIDAGNTFAEKSRKLGYSDTEMGQSIQTLQQMGLDAGFQQELVAHDNGPEVIDYLAKNPEAVDQMRSMSAMQAGSYIATNIVPKALNVRKTTSAPEPADFINGGGSPEQPLGPPGAVFK